ncbi:MAG: DUF4199 domain-containing protein [Ignavibacteria bacterium]|nr:DUF4199 domain-containing protein [Ignavibacteria bacterium]
MIEFKYGLFAAFIIFVMMIIEYTLIVPAVQKAGYYIGIIASVIPLLVIYPAIKERRDKTNFGYITFREGFRTGIVITFMIAVMIVIATYVYFEFINKGVAVRIADEAGQNLLAAGSSSESASSTVTFIKENYSLQSQIITRLLLIMIAGTVTSIITASMLKKTKRKKPLIPDQ